MALTKVHNDLLDLGSSTDALGLPSGTTAQRPASPAEGTIRHNSEINETKLEAYDGSDWRTINKESQSSGGGSTYSVDFLVVAGGGGGAVRFSAGGAGGGGGAGGMISSSLSSVESGVNMIISIGAGGSGASYTGALVRDGSPGNNSSLQGFGIFPQESLGGGPGGGVDRSNSTDVLNGGSAGGTGTYGGGTLTSKGQGRLGQGNAGGNNNGGSYAGGGGGAGSAGGTITAGAGVSSNISGSSITYAFGGTGGTVGSNPSAAPAINTGGGGSGSGSTTSGRNGASGVIILRMATSNYSGTTTGSPIVTTDGTDTILTYTSSGTYTA